MDVDLDDQKKSQPRLLVARPESEHRSLATLQHQRREYGPTMELKTNFSTPGGPSQRPLLGSRPRRLRRRTVPTTPLEANRKGNLITKIFFHISNYNRKPSKISPFPDLNPLFTPFPPQSLKNSSKRITEMREGQKH